MLSLILNSYKMFFKKFPILFLISIPLLLISALDIYVDTQVNVSGAIVYIAYTSMLIVPLISAATDICIYRKLLRFNSINPLGNIFAFVIYVVSQLVIGVIGVAPIFLFMYLFSILGLSNFWSLSLAIVTNIFLGFAFMARFNVILPLIIQNKIPSLKEFLAYTNRKYIQWIAVALFIYFPYVVIHYLTAPYPYANMILTTLFILVFICFNINYINNNRLSKITYKPAEEVIKETEAKMVCNTPVPEQPKEKPALVKPKKLQDKKPTSPKKKPTTKKASKPKLKPVTA